MPDNVRKYLLYAVGEIFLVVIGILIALQINNWNEQRIEQNLSMEYLQGIRDDLQKDLEQLDRLIKENAEVISVINSIDPVFSVIVEETDGNLEELFQEPDTTDVRFLFYRGLSFRSFRGTYNALISDGKTGIIENRELFVEIQEIYDERHQRIISTYESVKDREHYVVTHYPYEKKEWGYSDLKRAKNQKVFLDLANLTEMKFIYARDLVELRDKIIETIVLLDDELST